MAELRLAVDISGRHSGIKKGIFADPLLNNTMRDAGIAQPRREGTEEMRDDEKNETGNKQRHGNVP